MSPPQTRNATVSNDPGRTLRRPRSEAAPIVSAPTTAPRKRLTTARDIMRGSHTIAHYLFRFIPVAGGEVLYTRRVWNRDMAGDWRATIRGQASDPSIPRPDLYHEHH